MKISKLITSARVGEVSGCATNLRNSFLEEQEALNDELLDGIMQRANEANQQLIIAIEKDRVLSGMEAADEARDAAMSALVGFVKGQSYLTHADWHKAALAVHAVIGKYSTGINQLSYAEQTAKINSLLEELASSKYSVLVDQILYLSAMISDLRSAQTTFEAAYAAYMEALKKNREIPNATAVKPQLLSIINNDLVVYLRATGKFYGQTHGSFGTKAGQIIDKINSNIRSRRVAV